MKWGLDSAFPAEDPGGLVRLGYSFACGYIGGRAANVWTPDSWRLHADVGLGLVPIWVSPTGTPSEQQGVDDGNAALERMQALQLAGMLILDVENGEAPIDYVRGFVDACHAGLASVGLYGSRTTLSAIDQVDAWWLAEWVSSGRKLGDAPPDWSMWQYATGPDFDYDVAVDSFPFASLGS
jgi:Domain of unknown function (DUF1906)